MKKFLALALVLSLGVFVVGCEKKKEAPKAADTPAAAPDAAAPPADAAPPAEAPK